MCKALEQIRQEIEQGEFEFRIELEDIHMHIERALVDRLGDVGRKLHTGRSRNDQVSTDLRLWVRDAIDTDRCAACSICNRPSSAAAPPTAIASCPATRTRSGPSRCWPPHYWLAYCEKFERDRDRLADCRRRANVLTLGTAALAGTSLPIDRA